MNAQTSLQTAPAAKACASCGTEIPGRDTLCAICDRTLKAGPPQRAVTLLHWIVFLGALTTMLAAGYFLSP